MMKHLKFAVVLGFLAIMLLNSCTENRLKIDVSSIDVEAEVFRLEEELFKGGAGYETHQSLKSSLGDFYKKYVELMIKAGPVDDTLTYNNIRLFADDKDIRQLYSDVKESYRELDWLNKDLSDAFKHYAYYFPDRNIPQAVSYISGFNYSIAATEDVLGIGLDMYLGDKSEYYKMLGYPQYKTSLMSKDYIVADAVKGWVSTEFDFDPVDKDFLTQMVHYGKIMYLMDAMMPEIHDTIKIGFSADQLKWCKENEVNIWAHFIDQKLLFSTNAKEIMRYINEGPFTSGFPKESPARIGIWMGWQVVKAYMERQSEINLEALMEADAQTVLKVSKYKPKW